MRILYHSPYPADVCSFYRGMGVLPHLPGVTVDICQQEVSWATLAGYDLLFMQRPYMEEHLRLIELAQPLMPVVVDYDDNLLEVPAWNPCWELYQQPKVRAVVKTCLEVADGVVLSTQALAEQWACNSCTLGDINKMNIILNAYNDYILPTTPPTTPRERIVFWRGSRTHDGDLMEHKDAIIEIANSHPDWRWVFMGSVPWMLEGKMRFEYRASVDTMKYFQVIREEIPAAIHIAPLKENSFNRAKSRIAVMEAESAQAMPVMEFDKDRFYESLSRTIKSFEQEGPDLVLAKPLLSKVNPTRFDMFTSLIEARK